MAGLNPIFRLFEKIELPYYGFYFDKIPNEINFTSILANHKKLIDYDFLFEVNVQVNTKNPSVNIITLDIPLIQDIFSK